MNRTYFALFGDSGDEWARTILAGASKSLFLNDGATKFKEGGTARDGCHMRFGAQRPARATPVTT